MGRTCFICNKRYVKGVDVFRMFPKDVNIRKQWINICGLRKVDDVSRLFICSFHFLASDRIGEFSNRLKSNAVPSIGVPYPITKQEQGKIHDSYQSPPSFFTESLINKSKSLPNTIFIKTEPIMESYKEEYINMNKQVETMKVEPLPILPQDKYSKPSTPKPLHKKRRFGVPRYVSEIKEDDYATPVKTKRLIKFIKINDLEQRKTIQQLKKKLKSCNRK